MEEISWARRDRWGSVASWMKKPNTYVKGVRANGSASSKNANGPTSASSGAPKPQASNPARRPRVNPDDAMPMSTILIGFKFKFLEVDIDESS
jgi:hypothetical protein